jgi:glycosyltransferase involved in cell wall biosynthesis
MSHAEPLRIWVLKDGEILPIQDEPRRMRTWMLADALVARGHSVTWWASTFAHQRKALLAPQDRTFSVSDRFELRLLHAGTYRRNVSFARYRHHRRLGRRFAIEAPATATPDVIVAAFPVIDLACAAVRFALERRVPVVVDVRDLWPDTFLERGPGHLRTLARLALTNDFRQTAWTLASADSVVAMSGGVLKWARAKGRRESPSDRLFPIGHAGRPTARTAPPVYLEAPAALTVGYVGTFGSASDLRTVIEAARRLQSSGVHDVRFVLAGDGDARQAIAAACRDLPHVVLPGWLGDREADALLAHVDVAILPWRSIPDAMPNKLFDYLSAGRPVLSSAAGELADLLDSTGAGWFYPSNNPVALQDLIVALRNDRQAVANASRSAQVLFAQRFEASSIYSAYAAHVESIAGRRERPAA